MERGKEMFDYRTGEGVRLYLPNRETAAEEEMQ